MRPIDYDEDIEDANDKYHESSDEDFNPNDALAEEEATSSSDEEDAASKPVQRKGKRKAPIEDELDSGDEVTIEAAKKRKAKKSKNRGKNDEAADQLLSDEDGEAGLIKTRAQRRVEQKEWKPLARTEGATVDVDALWAQMIATPLKPVYSAEPHESNTLKDHSTLTNTANLATAEEEEQITIKKVYTFAGQDTTEEKKIPRSSLDKYLSDGWEAADAPAKFADAESQANDTEKNTHSKIRRPLRRPSRFDANPTGYVRALAPEFQLSWPRTTTPSTQDNLPPPELSKSRAQKAQKLNVVDKSRMDWTGFVDKEGIAEELDTYGKTKGAYLGRMEFLANVEARKEEERRRVKSAATATTS